MPAANLSVIIVDNERSQRRALRNQLSSIESIDVEAEEKLIDDCMERAVKDPPDIMIVELDGASEPEKTLEAVEGLKLAHPEIAVFVQSADQSPELIMSAMRAGAQEFFRRPVDSESLSKAIDKVRRLKTLSSPRTPTEGKVVSLFSKRGGLGVTTLAVNLGIALSELSERRTALMDLDLQLGDITSFLDLSPEYNILDACDNHQDVDENKLQSCMTPHKSGVAVLAEPGISDQLAEISGHHVTQILDHLRSMYGYVVVDASHTFNETTYSAFEHSDSVLILTVSTVSSIRATKQSLQLFRSLGYGPEKVHIIVNRVCKADNIRIDEIEKTLDYPVFWTIPNNYKAVIDAINSGIPLVNGGRPSNVSKSVVRLAETLMSSYR